jgi:uncharacterized membrane protein
MQSKALEVSGRFLFSLVAAIIVIVACDDSAIDASVGPGREELAARAANAKTFVFDCDDESQFTVRATTTEAWVFLPEGTINLVSSGVGSANAFDGDGFELSIVGDEATFKKDGSRALGCQNDRAAAIWEHAKLNGADFRAVGNEPGWNLEILEGNRIVLVSDYGASRIEMDLPEPDTDPDSRTSVWNTDDLRLEVSGERCVDSMSGESFDAKVVVTWRGQDLRGCGKALH